MCKLENTSSNTTHILLGFNTIKHRSSHQTTHLVLYLQLKGWISILLSLSLLISSSVFAEFSIQHAETRLVEKVYQLDAKLDYTLSDEVKDALNNGISIPLVLSIEVKRERWYIWDEKVAALKQYYQLKYYALSRQYVIHYQNTGFQKAFSTLEAALNYLGELVDFPLLDKTLVNSGEDYLVYLRIYLDIEALPVPLRPIAYFSAQWRLTSEWFTCPLQPSP